MKYTRKHKKQKGGLPTRLAVEGLELPEGWTVCRSEPRKLKTSNDVVIYEAICRKICFKRFLQTEKGPGAIDFMLEFARFADQKEVKHHPEWKNSYNKVEVILTTHDVGGISDLDIVCAKKINEILETTFAGQLSVNPC